MCRRTLAARTGILILLFASAVQAREWSDRFGNSMSAKFVRVHEGNAVFLRHGKVVMVPFNHLVEKDQQYIRGELEKSGQADQLPALGPARDELPGGDASGAESGGSFRSPSLPRIWTDVQGRQITAAFVRTEGDSVVLQMNGAEVTVGLERLSPPDQRYVQAREVAETVAENAGGTSAFPAGPPVSTSIPKFPGGPPQPPAGWPGSPPERAVHGGPQGGSDRGSAGMLASAGPTPDPSRNHSGAPRQPDSYAMNAPSAGGGSMSSSATPRSSRYAPPASSPAMPSPPHLPTLPEPPSPPGPMFEEVGLCSNCNKEVSNEFGAGEHCPHCGVFFEYEEDQSGQKTIATNSPASTSNLASTTSSSADKDHRVTGRSIRGIVKAVLFIIAGGAALIGWVARRLSSE